jgi:type II secretion system protein H
MLKLSGTRAGYSLIEMMLVVVICGLVAGVGVPILGKSYPPRAVRGASDRFVTTYAMAQSAAVRYGRLAELHIDTSAARFWVEVDTSRSGGAKAKVGLTQSVGQDGTKLSSTRTLLCFDPRGLPSTRSACEAGDATVTFSLKGSTSTVQTTALGKVLR